MPKFMSPVLFSLCSLSLQSCKDVSLGADRVEAGAGSGAGGATGTGGATGSGGASGVAITGGTNADGMGGYACTTRVCPQGVDAGGVGGAQQIDGADRPDSVASSCDPGATLIGASYDITKSHFAFGSTPVWQATDPYGIGRWVGTDGLVAIYTCGAEAGLVTGTPKIVLPDWSSDSSALSEHVRAYFVAMGVDLCQIAETQVQAGTDGYSISLVRGVDGIVVGQSNAYAKFNVNDQTTQEGLYWPTIPAETVAAARAFRDRLANPTELAAYKAKLPASAQGTGEVQIQHSACPSNATNSTFQSLATYSAGGMSSSAGPQWFDVDGNPLSGIW